MGFQCCAMMTAVPWVWKKETKIRRALAKSLVCYVTEDDTGLTRKQFLHMVMSRIEDDLREGTQ